MQYSTLWFLVVGKFRTGMFIPLKCLFVIDLRAEGQEEEAIGRNRARNLGLEHAVRC